MKEERKFFKITWFSGIVTIALFLPMFIFAIYTVFTSGIFWVLALPFALIFLIVTLFLSWLIASLLDYFIKNKTLKITIATILAIVSIFAAWMAIRSTGGGGMVCDPVHDPVHPPGGDGGPVVCDPVHMPN
jgi:hypothetical protein